MNIKSQIIQYTRNHCKTALLLTAFLSISIVSQAQEPLSQLDPPGSLQHATNLYQQKHYPAAREAFLRLYNTTTIQNHEQLAIAQLYIALCSSKMEQKEAELLLEKFIAENQESINISQAWMELARIYYTNRKYKKAIEAFDKVSPYALSNDEMAEYHFKKGYAELSQGDAETADKSFNQVKDSKSNYRIAAQYYHAHIAYTNNDYETALEGFKKIEQEKSFRAVVPFYYAQIAHAQGDCDQVIKSGSQLAKTIKNKRTEELARITGECLLKSNNPLEATDYLERYLQHAKSDASRTDHYNMASAYFLTNQYALAIPQYQEVTRTDDTLAQNAWYHMGISYMKTEQLKFAAQAFHSAYQLNFNEDIATEALFAYARLAVEMAHDPYNEAVKSLQQYITKHPNHPRTDEAYGYISNIYMSTKNYKEALVSLDKIGHKTPHMKAIYQKISYSRGIELFNDGELGEAIQLMRKSLYNKSDNKYTALACYWMGEAYYRQKDYENARRYYISFRTTPQANLLPEFHQLNYNLGYTYFNQKRYADAGQAFNNFIQHPVNTDAKLISDAYLRAADCHYIQKQYDQAIDQYNTAIKMNLTDVDYAMYQKAFTLGIKGDLNGKAWILKDFVKRFPNSTYTDDARFEQGNTYLVLDQPHEALTAFEGLVNNQYKSTYTPKALLKCGLIHFNGNQNTQALQSLKRVVSEYPATPESKEALTIIKNIYVSMNKVSDYVAYVDNISFANVTVNQQDSLMYTAAENRYMDAAFEEAAQSFAAYIQRFPLGAFFTRACYYMGESEEQLNNPAKALPAFEKVIELPVSEFTENALLKAARIHYDSLRYNKAYDYYQQLETIAQYPEHKQESIIGQMHCAFLNNQYNEAIAAAQKVLMAEKSSDDIKVEAHLTMARSAIATGDLALAQTEFSTTQKISQAEAGAEAQYNMALIQYQLNNLDQTTKLVYALADNYSSYDYWVVRGFILLSDVFVKQNDLFQARQTLESILGNYTNQDEIPLIAQRKLKLIKEQEESATQNINTDQEDEIYLDNPSKNF